MVERRTARNLVVSLMLSLSLAACGDSTTPPSTDPPPTDNPPTPTNPMPKEVSGTVEGWTGGEAVVRAEDYNLETGEPIVLAQGTISADGSFNVTLPVGEDIPADAFDTVREADTCPTEQGAVSTIEVTPSGPFDLALIYSFVVYDSAGSNYLGDIYLSGDSLETSYSYAYVASDVTVTGECVETYSGSGGGFSSTTRFDLNFKAGWNELIATYDEEAGSVSTGSIPAGVTWSYSEVLPPPPPCEANNLEPVYEVATLISIPEVVPVVGVDLVVRPAHSPPPPPC